MRRRAAEISGSEPGARLPVPEARDEVRRLGETLNQMLERVDGALERERDFVADASHELRTPLTILRAELELANSRPWAVSEPRRARCAGASEEAERLARLADDLLVVARADGGSLPVRAEPLEAAELLETARDRLALRAAEGGRALMVDAPEGLELSGDRLRLEQAVGNLLDNALWHGAGRITLGARRETGPWSCGCATRAGASPRSSCRAPSTGSRAPTTRAGAAGPGSAWPSCRPSRRPTAARRGWATHPDGAGWPASACRPRSAAQQAPDRRGRIVSPHKGLADQDRVDTGLLQAAHVGGIRDPRLRDHHRARRDVRQQPQDGIGVDLERLADFGC